MKGKDIILYTQEAIRDHGYAMEASNSFNLSAHNQLLEIHARALACHCECLGMNAENSYACCVGNSIPYGNDSYIQVMKKWGLINEKSEPII